MIALDRIRHQGFTLQPVADGLYIDPIDELTDVQREGLLSNKPAIRQQLIAERSQRWQWFLSLATEHGIHPDVMAAEFATDADRLDVIEPLDHDDDRLRRCMADKCNKNVSVRRRQREYEAGRWVPVHPDGEVAS